VEVYWGQKKLSAVKEHYITDEHGERIAMILPLHEYERLQEDLHDLAVAAERRDEPAITLEEIKKANPNPRSTYIQTERLT